ncbi:MAG: 30S ribosomal protein S16 [Candidatus Pacebacteria bacterium]|nr:30S ribosomal protein S16 [Candidatus Paceibacterota bacterium]
MLKVKLARFGKRNQPHYRIVVNEARDKRDGSYVALIGHYAPTQTPKLLDINVEEYDKWIGQGAQPTDTVAALVEKFKSGNPFPEKKNELSKKAKAKLAEEKKAKDAAKEEAKVAPVVEEKTGEVASEAQAEA